MNPIIHSENGGFWIYFGGKLALGRWPECCFSLGIIREMTFLELVPGLVALTLYNQYLQN